MVSHLDAAIYWGWKIKQEPDLPHVTMPRGHRRPRSDRDQARVHWSTLPAGSIYRGKVTQRARTVADCCRDLPWDEALCVVDSALREGKLTREELLAEIDLLPRTGRERARRVVLAADGRAANPFESCLRAVALTVPGLNVIPQFRVDDIGRADLVDPALRLVVEADSAEHHSDPASFRYDIRRYTAMVRKQWRVIRFCWEDVMFKQDYVRAVLADMVALGPPGYKQFVVTGSDPRLGGGT